MRTIDRDELRQRLAGPRPPRLVQTLGEAAFAAARIPGSERFSTLEEARAALRGVDEVVVYCSDEACHASVAAYFLLERAGIPVRRYAGGLADWHAAGLPLDADARTLATT